MIGNSARFLSLLIAMAFLCGCTSFQTTKNVWKGTKDLWATYVSPPASVDYEAKGDLKPEALALASAMMGTDIQLGRLERVMQNADRPPTQEWLDQLFQNFPWISGFAGIKYDGTILGQQPPDSLKDLDFNYLLYEDKKQKSRALRADVQPSPLGPEIMLAAPLYDGIDFLGIVVAYFDMRALMGYSDHPQDMVVLCPTALLWPGRFDFATTPLAGVDWSKVVQESAAGTCHNINGTFFYMVRYLGNLPLVFAVPQKGDFPEGSGSIEQGFAFFPPEREKMAPPPVPEGRADKVTAGPAFIPAEIPEEPETMAAEAAPAEQTGRQSANEIEPGSRESVLLKGQGRGSGRQVQERNLEGENVPVERVQRQRRPASRPSPIPLPDIEDLAPPPEPPKTIQRPSPFGPRPTQESAPAETAPSESTTPAKEEATAPAESKAQSSQPTTEPAPAEEPRAPATLPGGRPSPFGPR